MESVTSREANPPQTYGADCPRRTHLQRFVTGGLVTNREYRRAAQGALVRLFAADQPAA